MIKHFCDICETELDNSRIKRNNIVVPLPEKMSIAIAINIQDISEPSICTACLFAQAEIAGINHPTEPKFPAKVAEEKIKFPAQNGPSND